MATILALVALTHVMALAAVLLLARYSVVLVDDDGRPLVPSAWRERVVPTTKAARPVPPTQVDR